MMTVTDQAPQRLQVTIEEAARMLSYDVSTVRRKIARGEIKATGHGRGRRVPVASLQEYIEREQE
jgi:excisionase family DNA binding protein